MPKLAKVIMFWAVAALIGLPAAHANLISNGSFEVGNLTNLSFTTVPAGGANITDWMVGGGGVDYIGGYWQASDGHRSVDLSGNSPGSVSQQTFGTTAGAAYEVSFWLAGNPDKPGDKKVRVSYGTGDFDYHDYTFIQAGHTKTSMGWEEKKFTFTAAGASTTLKFESLTGDAWGPALDQVGVEVVPVPPSVLLLGTGLLGLAGLRWRRSRTEG
jgi:choice-of-anchor C domain-containing protein